MFHKDPIYKSSLKQLLSGQSRIYPDLTSSPTQSERNDDKPSQLLLLRPKSLDDNIQDSVQGGGDDSLNGVDSPALLSSLIADSFNKLAFNKSNSRLLSEEPSQVHTHSCSSSPSSSSSLPTQSNEFLVSSSSSTSSTSTSSSSSQDAPPASEISVADKVTSEPTVDLTVSHMSETTSRLGHVPVLSFQLEIDDSIKKQIDEKLKECSDSDSEYNVYMPKAVDLPSAQRLAKRLYYLDGFKANDVVRHLSKKLVHFYLVSIIFLFSLNWLDEDVRRNFSWLFSLTKTPRLNSHLRVLFKNLIFYFKQKLVQ